MGSTTPLSHPCQWRPPPVVLQGVGKGTYATRVSDAFGLCHIAAGDLVRTEIKQGSEVGKQVRCWGGGALAGLWAVGCGHALPPSRHAQCMS